MTIFLWTALLATCAGLMWALAAFDRIGSGIAFIGFVSFGAGAFLHI